ncbi:pyridoxal kinase-like [Rhopalosiphum maidis]|uniref:pyridoxal kinase-like n=1 Tax=Rhopalosiphum maidis TaxID=43146 RepID=UPI000EFFA22B|nr:pyridoxal kinase-like [Rhopalosiphum maidis]
MCRLSITGFEADTINSVQSNHTGYKTYRGQELNESNLAKLITGLVENELHNYSHLLNGYIGCPMFLNPKSNRMAERAVQTAKQMLRKTDFEKKEILDILLEYSCTTLPLYHFTSPCELVMSRLLRTRMLNYQANYKEYYDKITKFKDKFNANDDVVVNERRVLLPCKILSKLENYPWSYVVKLQNG